MLGGNVLDRWYRRCLTAPAALLIALSITAPAWATTAAGSVATPPARPVSCASADALFEAGSVAAARGEYERLAPGGACATSGLVEIRELIRLCDLGHSDLRVHRKGDALAAYKSALAKNPNAQCAIAGVISASPDRFTRALERISTALPNVPTALAGLALLLVAVFATLVALGSVSYHGKRLRVDRIPGLRTLLRPRIALATISDEGVQWSTEGGQQWKVGASMTAQIKERLQRFREEALSGELPDNDLDFGSTNEAIAEFVSSDAGLQTALDKVGELSESTKVATALLELIYAALPIRRLSVSGVLDPPGTTSASITLSMESGSRLVAAATLKSPLLDTAKATSGDYMRLVDQAAVWVQFEVTKALTGNKVALDAPDSYARLREGLDRYFAGEPIQARAAFEEALTLNASNWAAAIDLASTEARLAGSYPRAIEILERAIRDIRLAQSSMAAGQER
jgi:tetratricopeptide (TPR) repeat protein